MGVTVSKFSSAVTSGKDKNKVKKGTERSQLIMPMSSPLNWVVGTLALNVTFCNHIFSLDTFTINIKTCN